MTEQPKISLELISRVRKAFMMAAFDGLVDAQVPIVLVLDGPYVAAIREVMLAAGEDQKR